MYILFAMHKRNFLPSYKNCWVKKEVLAIGVKKEDIEAVLNAKIENTATVIKNFCTAYGLEFTEIKSEIQKLIDKK